MKVLKDLVIDLYMNKYAFFTSGYVGDFDTTPLVNFTTDSGAYKNRGAMQRRSWKITKCMLIVDIIYFDDPIFETAVDSLLKG